MAMTFRFPPDVIDDMSWMDFLAFVDQIDANEREINRQQAQSRMAG